MILFKKVVYMKLYLYLEIDAWSTIKKLRYKSFSKMHVRVLNIFHLRLVLILFMDLFMYILFLIASLFSVAKFFVLFLFLSLPCDVCGYFARLYNLQMCLLFFDIIIFILLFYSQWVQDEENGDCEKQYLSLFSSLFVLEFSILHFNIMVSFYFTTLEDLLLCIYNEVWPKAEMYRVTRAARTLVVTRIDVPYCV